MFCVNCLSTDFSAQKGVAGIPLHLEVSADGINYSEFLEVDTKDQQFTLDITRIDINVL